MSKHTLHVHRANTPGNGPATGSEYIDRWHAGQMRWAYRMLRRQGVSRGQARMLHLTIFVNGFAAGMQHGFNWHRERAA